jgi:hypothetical protein
MPRSVEQRSMPRSVEQRVLRLEALRPFACVNCELARLNAQVAGLTYSERRCTHPQRSAAAELEELNRMSKQ